MQQWYERDAILSDPGDRVHDRQDEGSGGMGWFGTRPAWRSEVDAALEPARAVDRKRTENVARFILTGRPSAIVKEIDALAATAGGRSWTAALVPRKGTAAAFQPLVRQLGRMPAEVGLRWGIVVHVARDFQPWEYGLGTVGGGQWVESLLKALQRATAGADLGGLTFDVVTRILAAEGVPEEELLRAAFRPEASGHGRGEACELLLRLPGFGAAVASHAAALVPLMERTGVDARLQAIRMLGSLTAEELAAFTPQVVELATASAAQVRTAALPLLDRLGPAALVELRRMAREGKPEQRLAALTQLWVRAADDDARAELLALASADRAASVRGLAERWTAERRPPASAADAAPAADSGSAADAAPAGDSGPAADAARAAMTPAPGALAYEPAPPPQWSCLTPEADDWLARFVRTADDLITAQNRRVEEAASRARAAGQPVWPWMEQRAAPLGPNGLKELRALLASPQPPPRTPAHHTPQAVSTALLRMIPEPALSPPAVVKVLAHLGRLLDGDRLSGFGGNLINQHHRATGAPSLLELERLLQDLGLDGWTAIAPLYFWPGLWDNLGGSFAPEKVWPFFAEHLDDLLSGRGISALQAGTRHPAFFTAIASFPEPPAAAVEALYEMAFGTSKTDRTRAQAALERHPGREQRAVAALADGRAGVRTAAAAWLRTMGTPASVPALEKALAKEKLDAPTGAMLDALAALGQPMEKYLDRDGLAARATAAVAKGLPTALGWLRWDALPTVRWADSGAPVPLPVLQWLVAQAVRARSPEPNALLRHYCALLDPTDREALGQWLLEAWVAEDLRPSPGGSAIASKGVLAVAAACAGRGAAPVAAAYLKEWYGQRLAQGKALIGMLAWIEHPSATQLMLSVGSRFRTRGLQAEAAAQAEALAERKGWTLEELADRTIPTAGFDETGTLPLSYGERVFTAHLRASLTIELRDPDGTMIKSLPAPRRTDDEARAAEAKKNLAASRRELKGVLELQRTRLYEAMCTQRAWPAGDWQRFLAGHPVMRFLVERLVWVADLPDGARLLFRPLGDGTLTDVADAEVVLPDDAVVRLAHEVTVGAEAAAAWQAHLVDYEVTPLFRQFGKGRAPLPVRVAGEGAAGSRVAGEPAGSDRELADFQGHLLESFALRSRATKLGYVRGPAEDGGWFMTYRKPFPTLGLATVIGFTGNPLPEEDRTVALTTLTFEPEPAGPGGALPLAEIPSVLLAEAYDDVRQLAADGTGFDPDWERKSEYR